MAAEALIGDHRAAIFDAVRPLDHQRQRHAERSGTLRVAQERGKVRGLARAIDAALGVNEGIEAARRRTAADAAVAEIERRRGEAQKREIARRIGRGEHSRRGAEVIDNSTNQPNNYLTLNAGSEQGVSEGMGAISPSGIVGLVIKVSPHYSVVMSLLHQKTLVSAMFKKSGTFGTLAWGDKMDYRFAAFSQIPMSEKVKLGDTIVTSGFSNIFPKGIMVGTVNDFKPIPEQYFYSIQIKLSTDFKNLKYVHIVADLKKTEKETLEKDAVNSLNDKTK